MASHKLIILLLSLSITYSNTLGFKFLLRREFASESEPDFSGDRDSGQRVDLASTSTTTTTYSVLHRSSQWIENKKQYVQISVTRDVFYYTPITVTRSTTKAYIEPKSEPSYVSYVKGEIGKGVASLVLREEPKFSPYPGKTKYLLLQRTPRHHRHKAEVNHIVYDVMASKYK